MQRASIVGRADRLWRGKDMGAYSVPAAGMNLAHEEIDAGTAARTRMPPPGPTAMRSESLAQPVAATASDAPWSGGIPIAAGLPSIVRIPIPGTGGLCIELSPRGWTPAGGSTSSIFFQDLTGKRHLRLDFGYNVKTKSVNFHWNQSGTFSEFGIADHTLVNRTGAALYRAAKYFRYAGRVLVVVGVAIDVVSIVRADRPLRRASQVVAGWAAASMGCRLVGAGGAALGTLASPIGTFIGGTAGCIVGGIGGYYGASVLAGEVFDWAEGTNFVAVPQVASP
jgi:hypothetical protein